LLAASAASFGWQASVKAAKPTVKGWHASGEGWRVK
jgi:hypothetical protein